MTMAERVGEMLARRTTRRQGVTRVAAATFGLTAAWATQGPFGSGALASVCARRSTYSDCNPPHGAYCSSYDTRYCDGARCSGGCTLNTQYYPNEPQSGCWCTQTVGRKHRYYYKCCDCKCPGVPTTDTGCGCRKRVRLK